ncbi:MAG: class IIb bacteriocin, lactobin A/cerein 7B family [Streptococcaceae bacterium]|nr:class IIb bacteriocin, lactobin A/cerein 7B family [Streptococcaceae bacterium]
MKNLEEKYANIDDVALAEIEGGLFPIVIGGVIITGKAVAAGATILAGLGAGIYFGSR